VVRRATRAADSWTLTRRQAEVLAILARGHSNHEIAAALGCAVSTVEFHVTALLTKSRSRSRAELVARFWTELD
jgi:DNA-binding NarL/FixJ family response regulator